jgi:hypothetical protein
MTEAEETRRRPRYSVLAAVAGFFGPVNVVLRDISETGVQLEHGTPLRPGTTARGALHYRGSAIAFEGTVSWCRLSATANPAGKYLYRSGVRVDESSGVLASLIASLLGDAAVQEDRTSLQKKLAKLARGNASKEPFPAMKVIPRGPDVPPDQVLLVQQARQRLRANPEEARRWYNRARYATAEHAALPSDSAHREEVLAVWEYLERTIDLATVARAFELPG